MPVAHMSLPGETRSHWLLLFFRSTIGKKIVMALTGAIGVGYVVAHMLGNLQVFEGAAKINSYAALLKSTVGLLWTARSILIAAVVLHIFTAYQLARTSQKSRPVGYKRWRAVGSDFASRTMRWTGLLLAFFVSFRQGCVRRLNQDFFWARRRRTEVRPILSRRAISDLLIPCRYSFRTSTAL